MNMKITIIVLAFLLPFCVFSQVQPVRVVGGSINATSVSASDTNMLNWMFAKHGVCIVTDALKHTYAFIGFQTMDTCRIDTIWSHTASPLTGNTVRNVLLPAGMYIPFRGTAIRFMRATKVNLIKE
jgi:hypothetical protein